MSEGKVIAGQVATRRATLRGDEAAMERTTGRRCICQKGSRPKHATWSSQRRGRGIVGRTVVKGTSNGVDGRVPATKRVKGGHGTKTEWRSRAR